MRALVLTGPGKAELQEVEPPLAAPGQVVVDVERVGVCGTDVELYTGEMSYLHTASLPALPWDAVVDASNAPELPAFALELVEPAGRVVYIGLAGTPSTLDTRDLVLKDVTAVGILGGSAGLAGAIAAYADGSVDARPLVAATIGLAETADVLAGHRPAGAGPGPKIHIDPRR